MKLWSEEAYFSARVPPSIKTFLDISQLYSFEKGCSGRVIKLYQKSAAKLKIIF